MCLSQRKTVHTNFTVAMHVVQFIDRISHHTDYIRSGDFHLWVVLTTKTRQSLPQLNLRRRTHHERSVTSAGHSMPNLLFSQISGTFRCSELTCELLLTYSLVYFFPNHFRYPLNHRATHS